MLNPIYPCLWFNGNAKVAAEFYCSVFRESKILSENPVVVSFEINKTRFIGLNGGPQYHFTPATSFVIECEDQNEIDHYWNKLGDGGNYQMCGWLTDQFGVSWQVIPKILSKLMSDPAKTQKITEAFLKMQKFDIETLLNV